MTTVRELPNGNAALSDVVRVTAAEMGVEQLAHELGVSKKWAYALVRRRNGEAMPEVPTGQRNIVLLALLRHGSRDVSQLVHDLHADGTNIDAHDVTKTLWSLQKTGHVRFRERQNPRNLYAVKLTPGGAVEASSLTPRPASYPGLRTVSEMAVSNIGNEPEVVPEDEALVDAVSGDLPEEAEVIEGMHLLGRKGELVARPWPLGDLTDWPAIHRIWERATKSFKLSAAAKLLEEAGEVDMALTLMGKAEFSPLEQEVVYLLRAFGELDNQE